MKIRTKIWLLPLSVAAILLVGTSLNYVVGSNTSSAIERLRDIDNPYMLEINQMDRQLEAFRVQIQAAAAEGDIDALESVEALNERVFSRIQNIAEIPGKESIATQLETTYDTYQSAALGATRAMLGVGELGNQITQMQASQASLTELVDAEMADALQATLERQQEANKGVTTSLLVNLLTGLTVLTILGVSSYFVVNAVWRELGDEPENLRKVMKRVADGDLRADEFTKGHVSNDSLKMSVQQMVLTLRTMMGQIRESTESISLASSEIDLGNRDLSSRTDTTVGHLQRTAAATEELTVTVGQTADSARHANQLASTAADAAARGGDIVGQVVINMREIEESSQQITEIIGVIDSIAFQTNILALNASVEAARAGEQGRGFAVVASEVQQLARRSAEAANQIKALIATSSEKVAGGTKLVEDAGLAMGEIVKGVQQVTDIIGEISAATSEQSSGLTSINTSVAELDDMTQQNSALVQQSTAAASSLSDQAEMLSQVVAAFRLSRDDSYMTHSSFSEEHSGGNVDGNDHHRPSRSLAAPNAD